MKPLHYLLLPLLLLAAGCDTVPSKHVLDLWDIRQYQADAERGDPQAQVHLGEAYASHWRMAEANYWYLKAARRGVPEAQYKLAQNYLEGAGVRKDAVEAYAWFSVASTQANLAARNARESLLVKLTRPETEAGDRRVAELFSLIAPQDLRYGLMLTAKERAEQKRRNRIITTAAISGIVSGATAGVLAPAVFGTSIATGAIIGGSTAGGTAVVSGTATAVATQNGQWAHETDVADKENRAGQQFPQYEAVPPPSRGVPVFQPVK